MTALAELAMMQGQKAQATTWLERASAENPDLPEPAMRLVTQYLKTGEKAKALTTVRKLQTANPTNPDLLDHLGQAQIANNDAATSARDLQQAGQRGAEVAQGPPAPGVGAHADEERQRRQ
ncbi:tetratricopeptide repeat protein [Massilia sp. B-10]|nr:tetratricopeptide repeat protein [Massilia sp. B-10]